MWTYIWYARSQADALRAAHQTLPCVMVDGQKRSYTATTTGVRPKEVPDAMLITRLRPLPVSEEAYHWYSALQAENQPQRSEWIAAMRYCRLKLA